LKQPAPTQGSAEAAERLQHSCTCAAGGAAPSFGEGCSTAI